MPTILELLEQKQGTVQSIPAPRTNIISLDGGESQQLIEIYKNKESYIFGTNYSEVKTKKPPKNNTFNTIANFAEQEATGLRVKSAAELNNPLLYGNEVGRISLRSTPDLEKMKDNTGTEGGDGGLIGKGLGKLTGGKVNSLSDVRDKVNSTLGIPQNAIPTRLIGDIKKQSSIEPVTLDIFSGKGTGLGKLLKESGGGTPKTIVKNAAGAGIKKLKKGLRSKLFGGGQSAGQNNIKDVTGEKEEKYGYSDKEPYSKQIKDEREGQIFGSDPIPANEFKGIDLTKVSPIHGVRRAGGSDGLPGKFGDTEYGFDAKNDTSQANYSPLENQNYSKRQQDAEGRSKTLVERGITNGSDTIMMGDPYTTTVDTDSGEVTVEGFAPVRDLVPLFIGRHRSTTYPMMAFRCNITGLTETSSPSWASNNFVGNPYKYYIFETVERSVSFNLQVYAQNPLELANNWSKLSNLTKLSYPLIEKNMAHPNFTEFTLGDMYKNKVCIVESLSYTFPDNGTWETDIEGLLLPKFIDVAITLKFVENIEDGSIRGLYSYPKNGDGVTSQHEIYSTPNNIEYYVNDDNGVLTKSSKTNYIDQLSTGKRRVIKIKTN